MIHFDDIQHRVTIDDTPIILQPLSYRMLRRLEASQNRSVSTTELEQAVWGDTTVSPETLKQRVFVLRKSLADTGISTVIIQSVRGEGYRLIVKQVETKSHNHRLRQWLIPGGIAVVFAIVIFTYFNFFQSRYAPVNNRMVLWTNVSTDAMPQELASIYEEWRSALSTPNADGALQLIFSARQVNVPLPVQARKSRAALISFFEVVQHEGTPGIRLQIIEPVTATILRSNVISNSSPNERQAVIEGQVAGIMNLLNSGKLYLDKAQRKNARNLIWQELRHLANPS